MTRVAPVRSKQTVLPGSTKAPTGKVAFGLAHAPAKAPILTRPWDFQELGNSSIGQNKFIYSMVISSRLLGSRTWNEFFESLRRDALGWYFWFTGSALMQTGLVLGLVPLLYKPAQKMLLSQLDPKAPFHQKLWKTLSAPSKLFLIASDEQVHQRKDQVLKRMKADKVDAKALKGVEKLFDRTINMRALMSLIGLLFTIFMVGIGIIYINIAFTRASMRKQLRAKQAPAENRRQRPAEWHHGLPNSMVRPTGESVPRSAHNTNTRGRVGVHA